MLTGALSFFNMALNSNYWTTGGIIIGLLVLLPTIMGFFGKNKFDVKGKVSHDSYRLGQPRLTRAKTVLLLGASEGMGKSVAKQLARKGANIIIVARNISRLEEALVEIKVKISCLQHATSTDYLPGFSSEPLYPTLPIYQCRHFRTRWVCPSRRRSHCLERGSRSRHRLVYCWRLIPKAFHRDSNVEDAATDGYKLLVLRRNGARNTTRVACSIEYW